MEDTSSANVEQFVTTKPVVGVGGPGIVTSPVQSPSDA
jgi:hypothetical protein